jgi:trypsin
VQAINFTNEFVPENATLTLTGFGKLGASKPASHILQTINLRVIDNKECVEAYKDFPSNTSIVGSGHMCTLNKKTEGACNGDR